MAHGRGDGVHGVHSGAMKMWLGAIAIVLYVTYGLYGLLTESAQERYERRTDDGGGSYIR